MRRGEVWWVEFDERRPVVLLSGEDPSGFRAMQVVAPADTDISGLGIEVAVGVQEGLPFDGVLRFAFPWPGFTPCTWLTTLSRDDLTERAGAVSAAKLSEIDDALRGADIAGARRGALDRQPGHHHVPALVLTADQTVRRHADMIERQFISAGGAAAQHVELAQRQSGRVVVDQKQ